MSRMEHRSNEARGRIEDDNRRHGGLKGFEVPASRGLGDGGNWRAGREKSAGPGGEASC